ncbi:putative ribonuclease H-like domain-containing protein [Tanacetum coccineum]
MKMKHYLSHTDYPIWEVIQKGNGHVSVSIDTNRVIKVLPPKTDEENLTRERERKARTTLLMALPEDHLAKFYKMTDAKYMWDAIKSRFGGVSTEDANQKFLRYLPSSWSQVSLVMRTKLGVDNLSIDDLYNNLRVFESDIKGSNGSSSSAKNVAFVFSKSTSSTNDVSTANGVSTSSGYNSQRENSSSYTDELMYSFFANQSSGPHLDHEDLEQLDEFDLEEMDLKWQVAMISMRLKKFYKKTGRKLHFDAKEPVGFDKTKVECYNCHKKGHFARECRSKGNTGYKSKDNGRRPGKQEEPKALVTLDGEGVDWTDHAEDEQENFALMAYSNSGSDTEVTSCSKECVESYAKLKKLYDEQREQLGDASIEIQAYTQALKKVEAQLVTHQKNQLWYEEKIRFMKIDLDDKTDVLTYHKKLLAEAVKEKEELKTKLENFQSSSKGLSKLLNSQMSKRDKSGLGYGDQVHDGVLSYENEVFQSVFDSRSSDVEDSPVHDRFANVEGMHAVPPPMTGNYMPSGPDREVDDSMFTYGPKQSKTSESDTQTSNFDSCESNSSVETLESVPEPVVVEPKVVSQPKVWSDAPIIEEYESDSDDEYVIQPSKEQEKPSFAFVNTVKHVKTPRETVKEQNTYSPSPKADKRDWNGLMSKRLGLGYGFTKKACFVCGSFSHLIRDCDFHEKRMAKQVELNKKKGKGTGQGENRPVWNNVQRLNHQNKFVPKAVLTKTGIFPVNTARQNLSSQAATTSTARKVNTARPIVNEIRPRNIFYKSHSPIRRPFNRTTAPKANFSNRKVNTAEVKAVSAVGGKRETDNPQRALKNKGIVDSGCSRHMTGNKAYLAEYQDYNGGPVAFGGSKGYITGKGKIKTGKLDFEDVCFVKELQHFNLFSVSQMCDKKNKVLFTDTECLVLSSDFKLPDENQVLLRIPRQNNMYSFNLENIVPSGGLACLIAKATVDESNKWHRRLGHVNFKNLNKLVKGNLVRGLPSKIFQNDQTCVASQKGKQHKASYKAKIVSSISQPLQLLHMDLFGPTYVRSINHKTYCLDITDDFSRCGNGTEFKNRDIIEFCGSKRIKREYSNAITPQQNGVDKRKNVTLIEAARTMLTDSFLPNTFWAEAVSTACYVLDRVLVTKPQNKTPYELITGKIPIISYIRPFGCHVTILNTIDHLGKFEGKSDEGFLVGYSLNSKAFTVYNLETKRVEENMHINFLENNPNVAGKGPNWLFDLDYLTDSMNYQPVRSENQANKTAGPEETNHSAGTQDTIDAGNSEIESEPAQKYFVLPVWSSYTSTVKRSEAKNGDVKPNRDTVEVFSANSTNIINTVSTPISTASPLNVFSAGGPDLNNNDQDDSQIPALEDIYDNPSDGIFTNASYDDEGAVADFTNLETTMNVSPIPTSRIHSIHPTTQILGDPTSAVQTRSKIEPKKISQALKDESWVDAMVFLNNQIELGEPFNDVYITPAHTLKVFSNMSRKGLKFLGRITPLFSTMLESVEVKEGEGGNTSERAEGGLNLKELLSLCTNLLNRVLALETAKDAQATKILKLKIRIKKLEKKCKPSISHHRAWLKSVKKLSIKKRLGKKEPVSKQGQKNVKPRPSLDAFGDLDADLAHVSTAVNISTTSRPEVSTATQMTPTKTSVFEDEDIFLADALVMLSDKAKLKGVEIKEMKDTERPARSVLTLKPLPKIDPKDKGKGVLEEEPEPIKVKSKDQDKLERQRQEQASLNYIANLYDEVQARIDADHELAIRWTQEEHEKYILDERAKLLSKYFENKKKQLAEESAPAIRNKPPTISQLRSLMMTYLKHPGRYKHAQLYKKCEVFKTLR